MNIKNISLMSLAIMPWVSGCVSAPLALAPVGPAPASRQSSQASGSLQVFSAQQQSNPVGSIGADSYFYPHSGYDLQDASGRKLKYVANHFNEMDESPDAVRLAPGHYTIVADSTQCGLVTVSVVIEPGKATVVHLDQNWWPPRHTPANQVVFLPDGEGVGWISSAQ